VRPVVTQLSTDPSSPHLQASVEVVDSLTRFGTVLAAVPAAAKLFSVPGFVPPAGPFDLVASRGSTSIVAWREA
jgi:hypothetical protein